MLLYPSHQYLVKSQLELGIPHKAAHPIELPEDSSHLPRWDIDIITPDTKPYETPSSLTVETNPLPRGEPGSTIK